LIIFALMLLPLTSDKFNTEDTEAIRQISISVFVFVIAAVFIWMLFSVFIRIPWVHDKSAIVMLVIIFTLNGVWGYLLYKYAAHLLRMTFFLIVSLTFVSLISFAVTFNNGEKTNNYDISFSILAITLVCISLVGASFKLIPNKIKPLKAMQIITLQSHFDGKQISLDEPYELAPNTKLVVSVIEMRDEEREDWTRFSLANLERAFGDDEPEYSLDLIKEENPKYEGR